MISTVLICIGVIILCLLVVMQSRRILGLRQELESETSLRKANQDAAASRLAMFEEAAKARDDAKGALPELEIAQRKNREYFDLIARVLAQRDEWTEMFYTHSIEHQRAQAKLESEIVRAREFLLHTIKIVNAYRDKHSEPHLELPFAASSDDPVGTAKAFGEKMDALKAKASPLIDGIKERDQIAKEEP